ncbi:MAG: cytochrome-c oxidase, cbb3-type subunit III [Sphingomonadales bacterium]|nr:cytochrome-c oxidase, cbb3-type subunit III [Sphingomonadales bacterium]MBD3774076.1 cytochrome-c oxidase, cbb3-type subunit III [Paracoccaceae bacterium]MBD3813758.1 cytochrome-c oxidase, cbb3-type subunit III [Betaproteobacteria bacterium]
MAENKRIDDATGVETVGHEWDGIEELNNPLPRWWVWSFYACIAFAIGYMIVYPAIPMVHSATSGLWGWSSRGQLADEVKVGDAKRDEQIAGLAAMPIEQLPGDPKLLAAAVAGGRAAFKVNCVQCHGSGAAGGNGYPNLNDDDWLWGGDIKTIETTLQHGIRQPGDDATRMSIMPSFGRDGILTQPQIGAIADHVLSLSGKAKDNPQGAALFEANCAVCHGADGKGMRDFGAPNLSDAIWLHAKTPGVMSKDELVQFISDPKMGVMPAWQGRLSPLTIKMLAAYVHSLGGGEAMAQPAAASSAGGAEETPSEQP